MVSSNLTLVAAKNRAVTLRVSFSQVDLRGAPEKAELAQRLKSNLRNYLAACGLSRA
jgi:hypothetical protein